MGRGQWLDNVFIEDLWRSLKCECINLNAFETGSQARAGIAMWITYLQHSQADTALDGKTPLRAPPRSCVQPKSGSWHSARFDFD